MYSINQQQTEVNNLYIYLKNFYIINIVDLDNYRK
jgi:hypothetical protein